MFGFLYENTNMLRRVYIFILYIFYSHATIHLTFEWLPTQAHPSRVHHISIHNSPNLLYTCKLSRLAPPLLQPSNLFISPLCVRTYCWGKSMLFNAFWKVNFLLGFLLVVLCLATTFFGGNVNAYLKAPSWFYGSALTFKRLLFLLSCRFVILIRLHSVAGTWRISVVGVFWIWLF